MKNVESMSILTHKDNNDEYRLQARASQLAVRAMAMPETADKREEVLGWLDQVLEEIKNGCFEIAACLIQEEQEEQDLILSER